jgi:hypothetical protein
MPQKNLRLPIATLKQIAALAPLYATEATVVAIAVQALYDKQLLDPALQEMDSEAKTPGDTPSINDDQRDDQ